MRDVDRGRTELVQKARELSTQLHTQLRVQVGERLVHQERARLTNYRTAHGHPLSLAAGERARLALKELLYAKDPGYLLNTAVDFVLLQLLETQPESDVVVDGQVRVERVALEHHGDVTVT